MKVKSMVIAASLGLLGAITAAAQTGFSTNVVGFVRVVCPPGFSIIANQLTNAAAGNITNLTGLPDGSTLYLYANGNFDVITYYATPKVWSSDGSNVRTNAYLTPGRSAWFYNPASTNVVVTFMGDVPQGNLANPLPPQFTLASGPLPLPGTLVTNFGLVAGNGDTVYVWKPGVGYNTYAFYAGFGWTQDGLSVVDPPVDAGQGFWYYRNPANGTLNWTLTYRIP